MSYLDSRMGETLSEGLEEYFANRDDLFLGRGASVEAIEFFRCHDTAHVVFGCATDLPSEACVKMWSMFATDAGLSRFYAGYALPESGEIYTRLTFPQMWQAGWASMGTFP